MISNNHQDSNHSRDLKVIAFFDLTEKVNKILNSAELSQLMKFECKELHEAITKVLSKNVSIPDELKVFLQDKNPFVDGDEEEAVRFLKDLVTSKIAYSLSDFYAYVQRVPGTKALLTEIVNGEELYEKFGNLATESVISFVDGKIRLCEKALFSIYE